MKIDNRAKLLLAALLALIAILLIIFWKPGTEPVAPVPQNDSQTTPTVTPVAPPRKDPVPLTGEQKQQASAQTLARLFAERYGSYSHQSEAANLSDLLPLTTDAFAGQLRSQIAQLQNAPVAEEFYGVTTEVLSLSPVESTSTNQTIDVLTQRNEERGNDQSTVKYQTVRLSLQLVNDQWLVDSAVWQE